MLNFPIQIGLIPLRQDVVNMSKTNTKDANKRVKEN